MFEKLKPEALLDTIAEQAWFQQLRAKWDELDAQSRTGLQWAAGVAGVLLVSWAFAGTAWKIHSLKAEVSEKDELIRMIQNATDELAELKDQIPAAGAAATGSSQPLKDYLTTVAAGSGVPAAALGLDNEKSGSVRDGSKETLAQVTLKKINLRQLVRFLFQMENGSRPIKLRNLSIETHSDQSGYLDATLQVSTFTLKAS